MSPISVSLLRDDLNSQIGGEIGYSHLFLLRNYNKRDRDSNKSDDKTEKHSGSNDSSGGSKEGSSRSSGNNDDSDNDSNNNREGSSSGSHSSGGGRSGPSSGSRGSGTDTGSSKSDSGSNDNSGSSSGSPSELPTPSTNTQNSPVQSTSSNDQISSTTFVAIPTSSSENISFFSTASTTLTSSPSPSSTLEGSLDVPSSPPHNSHVLPLGSIIAIILGILFCITISAVIYVMARPKFGKLKRVWRHSDPVIYPPYPFPNNESTFAHKEMGYGYAGSIYRPIYETSRTRPLSQSFASLRSFRFGGGAPGRLGSDGRITQITTPLPVARKSTQSKSSKGTSSGALSYRSSPISGLSASTTKDKSWYSYLAFEYPSTKYSHKTSVSDVDNYPRTSQGFEQHRFASPSFPRSSMSSVAIDRQTIIIPYRSSGHLEDVSEQEIMTSDDEIVTGDSRH